MTTLNGWKTSDGSYQVVSNDFINTGGSQMVLVITVYDHSADCTQYVIVNEEACRLYTANFIELDIEYNDDMLVAYYDKEQRLARESVTGVERDDQLNQLFDRCWQEYIVEHCKYFKSKWHCDANDLPTELFNQLPANYAQWLEENEQFIETDGERIIVDCKFKRSVELHNKVATALRDLRELKAHMIEQYSKLESDDDDRDEFYRTSVTLSFGNRSVHLTNSAALYSALLNTIDEVLIEDFNEE